MRAGTDLTRAVIFGACGGCTLRTIAGNALNDVLAQCVVSINNVAPVGGYEDGDGFTFYMRTYIWRKFVRTPLIDRNLI